MAISQNKYINIVSAVGGTETVRQRDLMGRVFTTNYLAPVGQVIEFTGGSIIALENIGDYFGITSDEYKFAEKYFQPNKKGVAPQKISFAGYKPSGSTRAMVIGVRNVKLSDIQAVTTGTLAFSVNGTDYSYSNINMSIVTSFADVEALLTNTMINDSVAQVIYDSTTNRFRIETLSGGDDVVISPATGSVAELLGWTEGVGIVVEGNDGGTAVETVADSAGLSNNFLSFCFIGTTLSNSDIVELAEWTSAQNVKYMFSLGVNPTNAETIQGLVSSYDGVALTLDIYDEMAEFMPMSRIASIDYTKPNAAISMFYQQFNGVKASVNKTSVAQDYDALRVNYYGATSQAGEDVLFYQNGVLQGSITDMGVYANEAWLKDAFVTKILNLRLGLDTLPANNVGVGLVLASMMDVINLSLYNGVTLPGKTLSSTQKAYITQLTGDSDAWMKVQGNGYYLSADLVKYTEDNVEKYKVSFLYVYSKGDSINYVDGRDIMI